MMLHEIAPKSFHIEWQNLQPERDDRIIFAFDGQILIAATEELRFPTREVFEKWILFPCIHPDSGAYTYLFAIDDERYFTMVYDEEQFRSFLENLYKDIPESEKTYRFVPVRALRNREAQHEAFAGMMAGMLTGWYRRSRFCGKCGVRTRHSDKERMMYCPHCRNMIYPQICPSVIIGVFSKDRLLTTRYNPEHLMFDGTGKTFKPVVHDALVAGYIEAGETGEDAVRREVMEEVGLRVKNIRYWKSSPWPMSSGLLFAYTCEVDGDDRIRLEEDELSTAVFKTREEIEPRVGKDIALTSALMEAFRRGELPERPIGELPERP
jgi:NAD+ diphosphatase